MFRSTIKKPPNNLLIQTLLNRFIYSGCETTTKDETGLYLKNKVVIVTGSGSGIGASTAMAFSRVGAKVVITDIDEKGMKRVAKFCEDHFHGKIHMCKADVTVDDELRSLVCETIAKWGKLDVLVNNAGILTFGSLLGGDLMEPLDLTLKTNLRACIFLSMICAPHLVKSKGNIVNLSSILGKTYVGNYEYLPYCISKAGLDHFMYGAALELGNYGVRVNNVCPGPTKTEIFSKAGVKGSWRDIGESFKIDNVLEPEEIADLIVYLASHKARSITGVRYYIDRGTLIMG